MRLAHVRERHAPAGSAWRLAAALDADGASWLDLEVARRRAVAATRTLEHDFALFRRPVTTLDDHLAAGLRVAALGDLVDGFAPRGEDDDAVLARRRAPVRPAGPPATLVPRLLRVRAACPHDLGPTRPGDPGALVPPASLLLLQRVGAARAGRSRVGAAWLAGARLRGRGGAADRHPCDRPARGAWRGGDRGPVRAQRLVGSRPPARRDAGPARAREGQGLRAVDRAVARDAGRARRPPGERQHGAGPRDQRHGPRRGRHGDRDDSRLARHDPLPAGRRWSRGPRPTSTCGRASSSAPGRWAAAACWRSARSAWAGGWSRATRSPSRWSGWAAS